MPTRRALREISLALREISLGSDSYRRMFAAQLQINAVDTVVLGHLYTGGPLTPSDLAQRLGFTTGSTTAVLNRIEKVGYLTRTANPDDGRSVFVRLTPGGEHAMQWVYEQMDIHMAEALADFPPEDIINLAAVLTAVGQHITKAQPRAQTDADQRHLPPR